MNLYIQIKDEQPVNHPAYEKNLLQAFGAIPSGWELFVRVEKPIPNAYQILQSQDSTYQKINNIWTDVWELREMTAQEKQNKIEKTISPYASWIFDEPNCVFIAPIPKPADNSFYIWNETTLSWDKQE